MLGEIAARTRPDTFLMGLNRLGSENVVDYLDPEVSKMSNALWMVTKHGPIQERFFAANLLQQVRATLRSRSYDSIVIRDIKNTFLSPLLRLVLQQRAFIVLLDATVGVSPRFPWFLSHVLARLDVIAYNSRGMTTTLEMLLGEDHSNLRHLPYGVDTDFFTPHKPGEGRGILSVGDTNRDYGTLVRALRIVRKTAKILSSGVLPNEPAHSFNLSSVPNSIAAVASVDSVSLRTEYERAEIVVIPLWQGQTASGVTSLLEAMSMQKAIVVASTIGLSEYCVEGKTVLTYRPGDERDLGAKIAYLSENRKTCENLGKEARKTVLDQFSTAVEGRAIARVLSESTVRPGQL
jgi:glycosyltransferase involved in cell wall biosynthesis